MLDPVLVVLAGRLGEPDRHHLRRIVPFVDRGRDVEALVALEADQLPPERGGEDLGDLRLADPRLAFEEQRTAEPQAQEEDRRQRPVREIGRALEESQRLVDRGRQARALGRTYELQLRSKPITAREQARIGPSHAYYAGTRAIVSRQLQSLSLPASREETGRRAGLMGDMASKIPFIPIDLRNPAGARTGG